MGGRGFQSCTVLEMGFMNYQEVQVKVGQVLSTREFNVEEIKI